LFPQTMFTFRVVCLINCSVLLIYYLCKNAPSVLFVAVSSNATYEQELVSEKDAKAALSSRVYL